MASGNELSEKECLFLKAVLEDKMAYQAAGVKFHLSYDEMSGILAKSGVIKTFNPRPYKARAAVKEAVKDVLENGLTMHAAATRRQVSVNGVKAHLILNGHYSEKLDESLPEEDSPSQGGQHDAQPLPETRQEIERIVDMVEKRQYLVKWQDAAEEEWVDEATFLAAVNKP